MSLPTRPDKREPVSADAITRLLEETRARTLRNTSTGHVHQRGKGVVIFKKPSALQWLQNLGRTRDYPFDITIDGTTATFRAGTINGYLPTNYLSGVTVPASGTRYLVLNLTASNGQITAATFSVDVAQPGAIVPTVGLPPTSFKLLIGLSIDAVPVKIWGNGNILATPTESFRADRVSITAGQLPYDIYYTWVFSQI